MELLPAVSACTVRFTMDPDCAVAVAVAVEAEETEPIVADQTAERMSDAGMRLGPAERRLPAATPPHAITSVYSQASPRERLFTEIKWFPGADRGRAQDALALASGLHTATGSSVNLSQQTYNGVSPVDLFDGQSTSQG